MPDQNQNSQNPLPGTLRTLKTDLDIGGVDNPQDRLQQAGNFIQARPTLDPTPAPAPIPVSTPAPTPATVPPVSTTATIENKVVEKKDIPATEVKPKPSYSWSNMSPAQNNSPKVEFNLDVKKDTPAPTSSPVSNPTTISTPNPSTNKADNKSGFSVLEDTIDLPLDNKVQTDINKPNEVKIPSSGFKLEPKTSSQSVEFNLNGASVQETEVATKPKSSMKSVISIFVVLVLLTLIGGGVYAFNMSRNSMPPKITDNPTDTNTNNTPTPTPEVVTSNPLFKDISKIDIAFVDTEPIRQTILAQLSEKRDTFIELNLTKDGNKVSLKDVSDALILTIPTDILSSLKDYWLYGYNQEGIYKLTAVIQLNPDKVAKELVDNWANSIPRDLSGFSINLPSRIVNTPAIKSVTITSNSGKSFNNNYYNYTSPADSIDVSSYENYILMASSQDSMRYILNQIP